MTGTEIPFRFIKKGVEFMSKYITDYVTYEDIDLIDKLDNMYESEISEEIYERLMQEIGADE